MTLRYDFDIICVFDEGSEESRAREARHRHSDDAHELGSSKLAMFRDPETVEALKAAPKGVRHLMEASGFGLAAYDSGAPDGYYPAEDEEDRIALMLRLTENLRYHDIHAGSDLHLHTETPVFEFEAFVQHLETAAPMGKGAETGTDIVPHAAVSDRHKRVLPRLSGMRGSSRVAQLAAGVVGVAGLTVAAPFLVQELLPLIQLRTTGSGP